MGIYGFGHLRDKFSTVVLDANSRMFVANIRDNFVAVARANDGAAAAAVNDSAVTLNDCTEARSVSNQLCNNILNVANGRSSGFVVSLDVTPFVVHALQMSSNVSQFRQRFVRLLRASNEMDLLRLFRPTKIYFTLDNKSPRTKKQTQLQRAVDSQSTLTKIHDMCVIERHKITDVTDSTMEATTTAAANVAAVPPPSQIIRPIVRMYEVVPIVRHILTRGEFSRIAIDSTYFDHTNGEGEIKAFSWLMCQEEKFVRIIMVRDNDVYVYSLAMYVHRSIADAAATDAATMLCSSSSSLSMSSPPSTPMDILVFHENTRSIIRCWEDLYANLQNRAWIFILWISICFGNDYTTGVLEKSLCSHQAHFNHLYKYIVANRCVRREVLNVTPFVIDASATAASGDASRARLNQLRGELLFALLELQNAIRLYDMDVTTTDIGADLFRQNATSIVGAKNAVAAAAVEDDACRGCDAIFVKWLRRHIWSLLYTIEMPTGARLDCNGAFFTLPCMRINVDMPMPTIRKAAFKSISAHKWSTYVDKIVEM